MADKRIVVSEQTHRQIKEISEWLEESQKEVLKTIVEQVYLKLKSKGM